MEEATAKAKTISELFERESNFSALPLFQPTFCMKNDQFMSAIGCAEFRNRAEIEFRKFI
jgi:hypothetical protein